MDPLKRLFQQLTRVSNNRSFLHFVNIIEVVSSKVLTLAMVLVLVGAVLDLCVILVQEFFTAPFGRFSIDLIRIFGLFLNVLIALEILENITAYLRQHLIQVELVVVTSLIAVARKIIVLDFDNTPGSKIIGLAIAILALSISYWLIRTTKDSSSNSNH